MKLSHIVKGKFLTAVSILTIILIVGCRKPNNIQSIQNLNNNRIGKLGHGGMGIAHFYPMNSRESLEQCISLNVDGTEVDVQLTKDQVLVLFRDEELSQSSNSKGKIHNLNWKDIEGACYRNPPATSYNLISLDGFLSKLPKPVNFELFIDCKDFSNDNSTEYIEAYNKALISIIDKYQIQNKVVIEYKNTAFIADLKKRRSEIKVFHYTTFEEGFRWAEELNTNGLIIPFDQLSRTKVHEAHSKGLQVVVVNSRTQKRNIESIEAHVDYIQSDRIKHLIRVLK